MIKRAFYTSIGLIAGLSISLLTSFAKKPSSEPESYYPRAIFTLERSGYSLAYDGRTKGAIWVYELLSPDVIGKNTASREHYLFQEDEEIPDILRSTNADYRGSGYDRGHLCPAMDLKYSDLAMKSSFFLTNISPQVPKLNRGHWKTLETIVKKEVLKGKTAHVYTLPLYLPQDKENKRFVHYELIGEKDVAVPTHFAKVVFFNTKESPLAFIFPNDPESLNRPFENFKTTVEKVEKSAGMIFPRKLLQ